jgi:hypothetical protein
MKSWPLLLRIGLGLIIVGTGPLALFAAADAMGMISDPDPNPIGLGLLFFVTFWPALICTGVGLVQLVIRRMRQG